MCGIYGSTIPYTEEQVKKKLERISFRGPDKLDWKVLKAKDKQIILGHNRLSIIDLDERSNQPFTYLDKIHVVFNGEIYNFLNIKDSLVKKGYEFKTTSDTEVLCAAYLEFGYDCVKQFNGMFAFVIYDEDKQLLFCSRDRFGQKPFYYYHNGQDFEFASQLSAIQMFNENLTISRKAISYYLAWLAVPDPYSIFNEISKLEAGYSMVLDLSTNALNIFQYWDIDYKAVNLFKGSYDEAKAELEYLIKDATKLRLFADVPVGVFLSGGVDSSLISALATKSTNSKVKTFSVKFNEKGFDESVYAQQVADHIGSDHNVIECNYNEGIDLIENYGYYYDEPFADSSAIPTMLLSKYTRKQVTVALSGDAGDEMFIGYRRYDWIKRTKKAYIIPYALRSIISKVLGQFPYHRIQIISKVLNYPNVDALYVAALAGVELSEIKSDFDYLNLNERKYLEHKFKNLFERVSDFDIKTYLNFDINTKVDRASMAYSLETRSPLMDYRVAELARSFPTEFKFHKNNKKRILKDVLYDHVPKEIFDRPKAGFSMPFKDWFRNDLKDYVLSELNYNSLKDIPDINADQVLLMIDEHMSGKWNRFKGIWKLLILKQWLTVNGKGYSIK